MEWILSFFGYCHASVVDRERGWLKDALDALALASKRESRTSNELAAVDEYLEVIHALHIPGNEIPESTLDVAKEIGNRIAVQNAEIVSLRAKCERLSTMAAEVAGFCRQIPEFYAEVIPSRDKEA